ncbi:response regulator [Paenibacillus qinlingensis]|uniref:Two-component system response regulator YesN n=1 Tax=Paenibacillus qinlingensis TaxID=1837343 RepID=A0ABU1NPA1_9BACL|nr:response regulator [Paenibacillus qinlingensis]MDR6549297.1 two-component system response regulator YesN [Paenibacillus qinlingensis]
MYDVLIVEDEPIARASLTYLLDWQKYGYEIKGEAEDGQQALEMMKTHYYSLVITDIRMPVMGGLPFIEELRKFSDAAVVILTGYGDFEYARQGLKLGVQDYLLKPVDEDDLVAVLNKVKDHLDLKYKTSKQLNLGVSALRDQFFKRWVHGQVKRLEFEEQTKLLGIPEHWHSSCCLLVEMDFIHALHTYLTDREMELKRFAIRNIIEEICGDAGFVFEESEERYTLLILHSEESLQGEASPTSLAEKLCVSIQQFVKETVSIGVGQPVRTWGRVAESFTSAEAALDGKFLNGHNTILTSPAKPIEDLDQAHLCHSMEVNVIEAMKTLQSSQVQQALVQLKEVFKSGLLSEKAIKVNVLEILLQLSHVVKDAGASQTLLFDDKLGDYELVMRSKTSDDLYQFIADKCMAVLELLHRMKDQQPNKVFDTVKRLVQEQFHTQISLRSVAQQVYMNPHYLGKLFKANANISFNEYMLQLRMERAKELLRLTDKKVYEIAQEVGFGELDWFYKRFKNYTGVSAGEFRASV